MIRDVEDLQSLLSDRINLVDIRAVCRWAGTCGERKECLFALAKSAGGRVGVNALWCVTHLAAENVSWLQPRQGELVDLLLAETHTGRRRMLLQLLREQSYEAESLRTDFLDYCLSKINSECEPYAIRCFCIYCAFKMCRLFPELLAELEHRLDLMSFQQLSPGLASALRTTRRNIARVRKMQA